MNEGIWVDSDSLIIEIDGEISPPEGGVILEDGQFNGCYFDECEVKK
jgi:hypothetical protein